MTRQLAAEALGTAFLLAIIVGSGLMADGMAGGNVAVALIGSTIAIGAGLVVLIQMFGPVSGAHFNPAVTLAMLVKREIGLAGALGYIAAQLAGAALGVWVTHLMFARPVMQVATTARDGLPLALAEFIATFGLIGTILCVRRHREDFTAVAVGLYILSACWFTASTSFANPAVTLARSLSDSFAGIAPHSTPLFILAQLAGALAGVWCFDWLLKEETQQ
ncbi:MIP/aquaporin family protein [Sphingomonas sp.]|uniref:aquaporin n=1 Tax=Sphingomonas sp. TaxID=28214 RepID=UPI001D34F8D0|nr:MIP/aquaporin family protein [Sphingomonas sp.]MBX9796571.1 aquaporin family protein [Sphingomonas sp.]